MYLGDFSFARSLFEHHRCKNVFATCYDSQDELLAKYHGQAEANIEKFLGYSDVSEKDNGDDDNNNDDDDDEEKGNTKNETRQDKERTRRVLYSIDARKLGTGVVGGGKDIRKGIPASRRTNTSSKSQGDENDNGPWDIISFNFPHVGGLSTDVNRQVRGNQELLIAFFKACVPLLSLQGDEGDNESDEDDYDAYDYEDEHPTSSEEAESDDEQQPAKNIRTVPRTSGQIIVTLFEGEPYTLWNIKDLARHTGLAVVTSFKFPWKSYPGYSHARTLGIVESRNRRKGRNSDDTSSDKQETGGWKGEDREARSYVFEVKRDDNRLHRQQEGPKGNRNRNRNKRGRAEEEDSESSDEN